VRNRSKTSFFSRISANNHPKNLYVIYMLLSHRGKQKSIMAVFPIPTHKRVPYEFSGRRSDTFSVFVMNGRLRYLKVVRGTPSCAESTTRVSDFSSKALVPKRDEKVIFFADLR
jgi:hypothetical protein